MERPMSRLKTSGGRIALCIALALGWTATSRLVVGAPGFVEPTRLAAQLSLELLLHSRAWFALTAVFAASMVLFALRRWEGFTGVIALACLAIATVVELGLQVEQSPPGFGKMLPSAVLTAWLVGWWAWRSLPLAAREERTQELACGVAAACLMAPGISKMLAMGIDWADGPRHALLVHERSFLARVDWLVELRRWVGARPTLCAWSAGYVLAVECAGFLYILPKARKVYTYAATAMFTGIALLLGFHAGTWLLVLFAMSHSTLGEPRARVTPPS